LWREDLRRDVALSHERADALSSVQDAMAQRQEAQAARLAELEQAVTAQLARFDQSRLRQDDAVAGFARRLRALEADLQHALRSVQQLQLQALTGLAADAPAASGLAAEVAQPVPLAGLASTEPQRFAPFLHVLQPLQAAGAQALLLHEDARAAWVEILAGQAEAGLTAVIV